MCTKIIFLWFLSPRFFKKRRGYCNRLRPSVCPLWYATSVWSPMFKKDSITLENVQRRATRLVNSLSGRTYEDRLKTLGLPTLEYRRLRADVIQVYKILNQIDRVDIDKFFTMSELSTRGNSLKIFKPRSRLKVRSSVFQTVLLMCGIFYQTQLWRHLHWTLSNQGWTNIGTDMSSNSMHHATSRVKQCLQILWEDVQMGL